MELPPAVGNTVTQTFETLQGDWRKVYEKLDSKNLKNKIQIVEFAAHIFIK
jgi:hypothetical protein